jgi:CRP-like cAMP-binding protein
VAIRIDPFRLFLQKYHTRKFDKGELILVQGETPDCMYVVKKGVVKTYNLTSAGEEKPLGFDVKKDIFPIAWAFGQNTRVSYYYEAFTDCELYCVPREDYLEYITKNVERLLGVMQEFVAKQTLFQLRVNALEQSKAAAKIVNTIHFLCLSFGEEYKQNTVLIEVPMTQQDLANFIGLTRETTGIELKKLQRRGVLTYKHQNYIVRTDKLNELLDEEYK